MNLAPETKHSLSNLSLCMFKIGRWLERACSILDRSHVLIRLAVERRHLVMRRNRLAQSWNRYAD